MVAGVLDLGIAIIGIILLHRFGLWYPTAYSIRGFPDYWPLWFYILGVLALGLRTLWEVWHDKPPFWS